MDCCLSGLFYVNYWEQISVKSESQYNNFYVQIHLKISQMTARKSRPEYILCMQLISQALLDKYCSCINWNLDFIIIESKVVLYAISGHDGPRIPIHHKLIQH